MSAAFLSKFDKGVEKIRKQVYPIGETKSSGHIKKSKFDRNQRTTALDNCDFDYAKGFQAIADSFIAWDKLKYALTLESGLIE